MTVLNDWRGVTFDALAVVAFGIVGRLQHGAASAFELGGLAETLWPFLAALLIAVLVTAVLSGDYRAAPMGAAAATVTVGCGLALRYADGQGIAPSFVVVTTVVLITLMLGWRFVLGRLT